MKSASFLIFICFLSVHFVAGAQGNGNRKPHIYGQDPLTINEDQSITVLMTYLDVQDPDDWFYPWGFTMTIYPGENYSVSGHVVTPSMNFTGKLSVQLSVHDGQDESNRFNLEIAVNPVNDRPVITGHNAISTNEEQAIAIELSHLKVTDPDNKYPEDFTMNLRGGNNYTVQGNLVVPQSGFTGALSVNVTIHDGQLESEVYALPVEVKPVNRVPDITGQVTLQVNEDHPITVGLGHLTVVDNDNNYPQGFTLTLLQGQNYAVSGSTVTPSQDFSGRLTVGVTVSDGKNTSKPFNLVISVTPVNDIPVIADLETEPVYYGSTDASIPVSQALTVSDVDGDSIMFAEVGIRVEGYNVTTDKLVYVASPDSRVRGVFDASTGVLTLLGHASPAAYTTALRSVHFQTLAPATGGSKTFYLMVNDGKSDSEIYERGLLFGQAKVSLEIPTGFTPNGDASNDTWKITPLKSDEEFSGVRIRVYNKAGALVYESVGFESEWDGRLNGQLLPADTYFYTIDLNMNAPEGYVKGVVTILR